MFEKSESLKVISNLEDDSDEDMDLPDEKEYDFKEVIMSYTGKKIRK